ncbi:response regulator transcription factor [Streptomyces sp. NPDC049555]|uniref:response regulator transcription factor n=1 Tax=Streptomyces sp. NPDC049555 TaxID=3154930 RepID=UPI003439CF38
MALQGHRGPRWPGAGIRAGPTLAWLRTLAKPPATALLVDDDRQDQDIAAAIEAGVTGLHKNSEPQHFVDAVRVLASRGTIMSEPVAKTVLKAFLKTAAADEEHRTSTLSARERSILALVAAGLSDKDIADRSFLSPGTVKGYLSEIMAKTGVSNRVQAAVPARRAGLADVA